MGNKFQDNNRRKNGDGLPAQKMSIGPTVMQLIQLEDEE
jgi:hypothetical protein